MKTNAFNIDTRDYNEKTPLHYAALNGADEVREVRKIKDISLNQVFEMLVGLGADLDALDGVNDQDPHPPFPPVQVGATPLHFAVRWGSEAIVKFILRKKARTSCT